VPSTAPIGEAGLLSSAAPPFAPVAAPEPPTRRVVELDGLRGVAIALVVFLHYVMRSSVLGSMIHHAAPPVWALLNISWCGVDLFFVISGFLIGGILLDHRASPTERRTFYLRRACRILPVYALLLLFCFTTLFAAPSFASYGSVPLYAYAFFIQNFWTLLGAHSMAFLDPTWSIAIEEQFYFVAPFVVPLLSMRTLRRVLVACIVVAPFLRWLSVLGVAGLSYWDFTLCRIDAPAMGVLGAVLVRDRNARFSLKGLLPALRRALPFLLAGIVLASQLMLVERPFRGELILYSAGISWLALTALATVLVVSQCPSSIAARIVRFPGLVHLGRRSYFIYLFHMPALWTARSLPFAQALLAASVLVLAMAELSWWCLEQPILRFGHRFGYDTLERETLPVPAPAALS
jgi:peptidoglycan/LPS O-acetylase OafA/YrhL